MQLAFDEIQNVVVSHRVALQRMVAGGISPEQITFRFNPPYPWDNTNCTSDKCKVYHPAGGGVSWYNFVQRHPDLAFDPNATTILDTNAPQLTWVANQGTDKIDFVYIIAVNEKFCNFINKKLGVNVPTTSMVATAIGLYQIDTLHTPNGMGSSIDPLAKANGQAGHLAGLDQGCFLRTNAGTKFMYFAALYPA